MTLAFGASNTNNQLTNQVNYRVMAKLSELRSGQKFKLATSDNTCVFVKSELQDYQVKVRYTYLCVNSGNEISTYNDYEVFTHTDLS